MTRIFISYSRRDKAVADYIGAELRNRGADVFIDYQKLIGGENFIGRLGREIETCDFFILLLSPRSVASKWVQAEAAWALRCDKPIIPVLLEPASMTDFFFLTNAEQVDFTRWSVDGQVGEAVCKLAEALGLSTEPIRSEPVPEPLVRAATTEGEEAADELETISVPAFARGDLSELFLTAAEVAHQDPEQAIFLYRRVIEIDPEYMQGKAQEFVRREEARLKPVWKARMLAQAEAAMKAGEWSRAERVGRDMLALDENNFEAKRIVDLCVKNAECESMYQHVVLAAQAGRWGAVATLMRDIKKTCPDYGDPAGVLTMRTESVGFLRELATLTGWGGVVYSVAFSPDGLWLASALDEKTIMLREFENRTIKPWEMPHGRQPILLKGHSEAVYSVAFSPDGSLLASASHDRTIKLWEIPFGFNWGTLKDHSGPVYSAAFSPDGSLLASASDDKTIKLWEDRRELATLTGHNEAVFSVAFSPDGSLLASASADGTIKLWETLDRRELATLTGHNDAVYSVAFSPDGSLLASASEDKTIKLWETPGGRELTVLTSHNEAVYSVAFLPNGSLLASASGDKTIKLWEMPGGRELSTLTGHNKDVRSVAFSPDGSLLTSASADGTVRLWGLG
jgi:WD40 repeat protein